MVISGLAFREVSALVTGNISVSAPAWLRVFNVHPSKKKQPPEQFEAEKSND